MGILDSLKRSVTGEWRRPDESSDLYREVHDDIMDKQMITSRVTFWPLWLTLGLMAFGAVCMIASGYESVAAITFGFLVLFCCVKSLGYLLAAVANFTERKVQGDSIVWPLVKSLLFIGLALLAMLLFAAAIK